MCKEKVAVWVQHNSKYIAVVQEESIGLQGCCKPAMMYGAGSWAAKKAQEKKLDVTEMRMLRWMFGVTRLDRIRNEIIRG